MSGYIGSQPVPQATQTRQTFTATSGQTSFATIGYVAGGQFIQVYLNGVLLKLTDDYTAANGSDIVLTSGAATGDILEFITFTDFTVNNQNFTGTTTAADLSVTGAFTSQGIDDNATSTAMTLDGSGNLLVGKASANTSSTGVEARENGLLVATRDGAQPLLIDRLTDDGDLILFRKDSSTTVGSIGTANGDLTIFSSAASHGGIRLAQSGILPTNNTGALVDASRDIGQSDYRFRNLYLSGGVFLGGTGSANKLDDYERGSFSFTLNAIAGQTGATINTQDNEYIVVGELVYLRGEINFSSVPANWADGDYAYLDGLPFTSHALGTGPSINGHAGTAWLYTSLGSNNQAIGGCHINSAGTGVYMSFPNVVGSVTPGARMFFSMTYHRA